MKKFISKDFNNTKILEQLLHATESTNFAFSLNDWDFRKSGGPSEHYAAMKSNQKEVIWNIVINFVSNCILLTPLPCLYAKITERHDLLTSTIGTLHMEDEAHEKAFYMAWILYPCFFIILIGQILFFYLYNRKYHPFSEILKGVRKQGKIFFEKSSISADAICLVF